MNNINNNTEISQEALHSHLMQMMKWFHNFCVNYKIRYYALGGTMLGAIRHQGFIPWDDDIDVGVPRDDYERMKDIIGNRLFDGYYFETMESPAFEYRYPYGKLYDSRTTLVEHTWPALKRGVFIDVFPLDGLGNTQDESINRWKSIMKKANYMLARSCAIRKERSVLKNAAILFAHMIPNPIARDKFILADMEKKCKELDFDECLIGGNIFGNWGIKEIMPSSIMGEPTLYKFGDISIYGAERADDYLTHLYGDWRKLPPKEKQITHHDFLEIDLNKPYI